MARTRQPSASKPHTESLKRASRLCRLLRLLTGKGATRTTILRRLRLDIRTFYRALESLREVGVVVELAEGRYVLHGPLEAALDKVPFPDPQLNLGEVRQLAKGRSAAHRKLKELLDQIDS